VTSVDIQTGVPDHAFILNSLFHLCISIGCRCG
jgi:hypothetical protein